MLNSSHTWNKLFLIFVIICTTTSICLSSSTPPITQYTIMGPNLDKLPSPNEALQLFLEWVREYGRVYKNLNELGRKFEIFLDNLKYITEENASRPKSSSNILGLNEFADWSHDEFKRVYLHENHDHSSETDHQQHWSTVAELQQPQNVSALNQGSLDWRARGVVTPVKNQGSCGSCWAFSAVGAIESVNARATGRLINLSDQEVLDCAVSSGCNGGQVIRGFDWVISNGIATEANYPYRAVRGSCRASEVPRSNATIHSYVLLSQTEEQILSATIIQPISISFWVADDFQHYIKDSIYDGPNCPEDSTRTNHAMLIVGFSSKGGEDYWIVKNSWGTGWGNNGYIYVKRNTGLKYGVCAINAWGRYLITRATPVSASSDQSVSSM